MCGFPLKTPEFVVDRTNPLLSLPTEPTLAQLGPDYFDEVKAASFPQHLLRFRNNALLPLLHLDPQKVEDQDFIEAFGQFKGPYRFLALRYHGYQFGEYNPFLGDGRGFLLSQVRGSDGELYDLGTKGSGTTPYSRGGDGRLTLKGGIREVLAGEALHAMGVRTSRCLSLVETGESLWRGDEPSPTRSSVMVRLSRSHIRFGTFERLLYLKRPDLMRKLLDHVIDHYYSDLAGQDQQYSRFFVALVERTAELAAQWMSVGFCHGVLNTDNMSITGESFDYGPYAFIRTYDPKFTAAYFDHWGYYRFGNQPEICRLNLERLQDALELITSRTELEAGLSKFSDHYRRYYTQRMLWKLGLDAAAVPHPTEILNITLQFLSTSQMSYHGFFTRLTRLFSSNWRLGDSSDIFKGAFVLRNAEERALLKRWCACYHQVLQQLPLDELHRLPTRLRQHNLPTILLRPEIEAVWDPIANEDDWAPFYRLLERLPLSADQA
jgi:uncharacterized protein YdiU (UPF0061 family)